MRFSTSSREKFVFQYREMKSSRLTTIWLALHLIQIGANDNSLYPPHILRFPSNADRACITRQLSKTST